MITIRLVEEQLARSYAAGLVFGGCHTYVGQEAVATGVCANLGPDDQVFGTHRGHGHALAKGLTPRELIAELYGKATGACGGRGGSMHLFKPEIGLMGTNGVVGPSMTLAAGAATTFRLARNRRVAVAFFGDGGVNNGAFHEAVNLAGAWELPVVFVCENNGYATEVPFVTTTRNPSARDRAAAYGVRALRLDGNDVLAVREAAREAVARARDLKGTTLLECMTYRTRAHAEGMKETGYRSREEVERWKLEDPIDRFRRHLVATRVAGEKVLDGLRAEVQAVVEEAHAFALASPWPDPATVMDYVFPGARHA